MEETNREYEKKHLPFGIILGDYESCAECGKPFDPHKQGKLRMAESFCSIECANKAYPNFNKR